MTPDKNLDTSRLGFHYYPDTKHYTHYDLQRWLPELKRLGTSWITLIAPTDRAVPEAFLRGLMEANIKPILQFHQSLFQQPDINSLKLLFKNYAKWGVRHAVLFDRPNMRQLWDSQDWGQTDLIERFLDIYLPIAEMVCQSGLRPVFPPLEPGGDYWDTAFLGAALSGMSRRCSKTFLNKLVIGAYAYIENQPIDWGAGGPDRWPLARPYITPKHHQDQRGFYIFDWYLKIAHAILGETPPMILLGAGKRRRKDYSPDSWYLSEIEHAEGNIELVKLICGQSLGENKSPALERIPAQVIACNFWLLTATKDSPHTIDAWFQPDGNTLPIVEAMEEWSYSNREGVQVPSKPSPEGTATPPFFHSAQAIEHYLLLPLYDWGVSEWYLDIVRPFILKHQPTVGFSPTEAARAKLVTVVGNDEVIPEQVIDELRRAGCRVNRISGDGTDIASILASN